MLAPVASSLSRSRGLEPSLAGTSSATIFSGGQEMILLQSPSRFLLQILQNRLLSGDKGLDLDCQSVEFDDVRYHIQFSLKSPLVMVLSVSLPAPPPEAVFVSGLPFGALEAIKAAYGEMVQILDPPKDGYNLTMKLNLAKLPSDEEQRHALLVKIASVRNIVLGAPLRGVLKHLAAKTVASDLDQLVALVHRPKESFFLVPQADKVTVVFPMRFQDSVDTVLATSFLQEFVEARRTAALNNAPPCMWSSSPPLELKDAPAHALSANAGFVSFVIFPRHVEGRKLEKTVWSLSTFHAYVRYHVKHKIICSLNKFYLLDRPSYLKEISRKMEPCLWSMKKSCKAWATLPRKAVAAFLCQTVPNQYGSLVVNCLQLEYE